jgi:hypothetical protein|nr:MAG TPA: major capsid protein [Caudoviricetes sp.]
MPANELSINQVSTILNAVVKQATGNTALTAVDGKNFATVAQLPLKIGYDPVISAISQVLSSTIFSIRPYSRKFKGINVSNQKFGNITRKLNIADSDWTDDDRQKLEDGSSIDMYVVKKPTVLQTNFYGANAFQRQTTIFKDQLDVAFSSQEEFGRFISMLMSNVSDMIEQGHESMARMCILNYVGGKLANEDEANNRIHLLTEYNELTGLTLNNKDVYKPENFPSFMKFVVARIKSISNLMTERSEKFHTNVTGKDIMRHTPLSKQKLYLLAPQQYLTETSVLSDLFNDKYMKMTDLELVNFWQNIDKPSDIDIKPIYMDKTGSLKQPTASIKESNLFGVIFDEEALGYTTVNSWSAPTPFNARGGYHNVFWHYTDRYWNDFTENGVVLLLD